MLFISFNDLALRFYTPYLPLLRPAQLVTMSTPTTEVKAAEQVAAATSVAQQSDNVAHALSGAGGGLLSMALT